MSINFWDKTNHVLKILGGIPTVFTRAVNGLVPKAPSGNGTTKYLREDGEWIVPPDNNTTTGTSYNAGSCPDNTTFATNGSVSRAYSALNTSLSNRLSSDTNGATKSNYTVSTGAGGEVISTTIPSDGWYYIEFCGRSASSFTNWKGYINCSGCASLIYSSYIDNPTFVLNGINWFSKNAKISASIGFVSTAITFSSLSLNVRKIHS